MDERHVPPIGLRYWLIFLLVSVFGGHMGDVVAMVLPFTILGRMVVLATLLAVIFVAERYDHHSSTDACYWLAVALLQIGRCGSPTFRRGRSGSTAWSSWAPWSRCA